MESNIRKYSRKPFIYGAMAAGLAAALLFAYLSGAFEGRGTIRADDVCRHVPDRQKTAKIFNSVLPRASKYEFFETWRPDQDRWFRSVCEVRGDDGPIFYLDAHMGTARNWQEWAKGEIWSNYGRKSIYFNAGLKGVSNAEVAAIWVPCYAGEEAQKAPWNMSVAAFSVEPLEASDKEARQTLIDLATTFARQAHKDAKCDLPSKLPGRVSLSLGNLMRNRSLGRNADIDKV